MKMKRASYREAVRWIAVNDNAGNGDSLYEIEAYVTTLLVADIFDADPVRMAKEIMRIRREEFGD